MNSLTNFIRFDSEGIELVVNTDTNFAYASISATARILETSDTNIYNELKKPSNNYSAIKAEIPTSGGLRSSNLLPASVVFELAFKYHRALAKKMGAAGANLYMLKLAGYEVKPIQVPSIPRTYAEALIEAGRLAMDNDRLTAQIQIDEPATTLGKAIAKAPNNIRIGDFAKSINMGQNLIAA